MNENPQIQPSRNSFLARSPKLMLFRPIEFCAWLHVQGHRWDVLYLLEAVCLGRLLAQNNHLRSDRYSGIRHRQTSSSSLRMW